MILKNKLLLQPFLHSSLLVVMLFYPTRTILAPIALSRSSFFHIHDQFAQCFVLVPLADSAAISKEIPVSGEDIVVAFNCD
jgi:hypothetical protein